MFQHVSDPKHQSTDVFLQSHLQKNDFEAQEVSLSLFESLHNMETYGSLL